MDITGLPATFATPGPADPQPLYRQIHARFRIAITQGSLAPGARIMSARALAGQLGVARGTVEAAYALLEAEGYVEAHGQAGTRVSARLALPHLRPAIAASAPVPAPVRQAPAAAPFELGCRRWTRFRGRYGRASARHACAPRRRPIWLIRTWPGRRRCVPRSPPICASRAGSIARRAR